MNKESSSGEAADRDAQPLDASSVGQEGDSAEDTRQLFEDLYGELKRIAARQLDRLPAGQTLHPTEIVHEAYGRLQGKQAWESQSHFLNTAAAAMRQLLVDRARRRISLKRGGVMKRNPLDEFDQRIVVHQSDEEIVNVHEALDELAKKDSRAAKLVELTFFLGMGQVEAAAATGISERTARRDLVYAHAWLAETLKP